MTTLLHDWLKVVRAVTTSWMCLAMACAWYAHIHGRKLSAVLWVSESETWKYMQTLSVHEDFLLRLWKGLCVWLFIFSMLSYLICCIFQPSTHFSMIRSCFPVKSGEKEGGKWLTRFKEWKVHTPGFFPSLFFGFLTLYWRMLVNGFTWISPREGKALVWSCYHCKKLARLCLCCVLGPCCIIVEKSFKSRGKRYQMRSPAVEPRGRTGGEREKEVDGKRKSTLDELLNCLAATLFSFCQHPHPPIWRKVCGELLRIPHLQNPTVV